MKHRITHCRWQPWRTIVPLRSPTKHYAFVLLTKQHPRSSSDLTVVQLLCVSRQLPYLVHCRFAHAPLLLTLCEEAHEVLGCLDGLARQVLHENTLLGVLFQLLSGESTQNMERAAQDAKEIGNKQAKREARKRAVRCVPSSAASPSY